MTLAWHSVMTSRNASTTSQQKHRSWQRTNMDTYVTDMPNLWRKESITQLPYSPPNMPLSRYPTYVVQNRASYSYVPLPTWLPHSNRKRYSHHQYSITDHWCKAMYTLSTPETNVASWNISPSLLNHIVMTAHGTHPLSFTPTHSSGTMVSWSC